LDIRRSSAVGPITDGLKRNVTVCPETEDHADRLSEWGQAEEQQKRCGQSPKPRHA
jgi:hypothetical protein